MFRCNVEERFAFGRRVAGVGEALGFGHIGRGYHMLIPQRQSFTWLAYFSRRSGDLLKASSIKSAASANRPAFLASNAFRAASLAMPSSTGDGMPNTLFDPELEMLAWPCRGSRVAGFQFSKALNSSLAVG